MMDYFTRTILNIPALPKQAKSAAEARNNAAKSGVFSPKQQLKEDADGKSLESESDPS